MGMCHESPGNKPADRFSSDVLPQQSALKNLIRKLWDTNVELINNEKQRLAKLPSPDLRLTFAEDPIRFQDALGRVICMDASLDWNVCDMAEALICVC